MALERRGAQRGSSSTDANGSRRTIESTLPLSSEQESNSRARLLLQFVFPDSLTIELGAKETELGREALAPLLSSSAMSRRHAVVSARAGIAAIRDLNSRNGLYVNGHKCPASRLSPGDVVRLGDQVAVVRASTSADPQNEFSELGFGLWGGETFQLTLALARIAAASDNPVLILGESGTGKEWLARAVHTLGDRGGRFVPVNCAAFSPALIDAELFGHEKGAFTGADRERVGLVQSADGGSLFLDELGELPPAAQAKLLRVIQEGELTPVGSNSPRRINVRFIGATHRDLPTMVSRDEFRLDLFHRLTGLQIQVPPLRERREDIVPLFLLFASAKLGRRTDLAAVLTEALCLHAWPGNVRELKQVAESMAVLHGDLPKWRRSHWALEAAPGVTPAPPTPAPPSVPPRELTAAAVHRALSISNGNIAHTAEHLSISRQSLYQVMRRHGIDAASFRQQPA